VVGQGVGDNDQTGLLEGTGDVVGEGTGGKATSNSLGTGVRSELQGSTLTVGAGRDDANVGRVLNGNNDTGSENNLLPGLADVDDVETYSHIHTVKESKNSCKRLFYHSSEPRLRFLLCCVSTVPAKLNVLRALVPVFLL
jgi:hypothetical protein